MPDGIYEFIQFIDNIRLVDIPLIGKKFTWFSDDKIFDEILAMFFSLFNRV